MMFDRQLQHLVQQRLQLAPAVVLLGVKRLEERLGLGGIERLVKLARTASNQSLDMLICDYVPYAAAQGALRAGRSRLDKMLEVKMGGGWDPMPRFAGART